MVRRSGEYQTLQNRHIQYLTRLSYLKREYPTIINKRKLKIIATIGPSSVRQQVIERMDQAGVDIFRVNLSHTKVGEIEETIKKLLTWTKKTVCIDTEGAQIRTECFREGTIQVYPHQIVELVKAGSIGSIGDENHIPLSFHQPWKALKPGIVMRIDFNSAVVQVIKIEDKKVIARVLEGGRIGSNKEISFDLDIHLESFTDKDLAGFKIAMRLGIDTIAFSFASSASDVKKLRKFFNGRINVISKIESAAGL